MDFTAGWLEKGGDGMAKYRNAEGYADPTAGMALSRAAANGKRKFVYICSPYSGDVEKNTQNARRYSKYAVGRGVIPLAPHLLFPQFLDDTNSKERELGLSFGMALLDRCSEVWVFGSRITKGMDAEIRQAERKRRKVRYFTDNCREVQR